MINEGGALIMVLAKLNRTIPAHEYPFTLLPIIEISASISADKSNNVNNGEFQVTSTL